MYPDGHPQMYPPEKPPPKNARGYPQIRQFAGAMSHQMKANANKGGWDGRPAEVCVWQVFYHAVKLAVACIGEEPDPIAIQEFAADTGNEAWILADVKKALDQQYQSDNPTVLQGEVAQLVAEVMGGVQKTLEEKGLLPKEFEAPNPSGQ